MTLTFGFDSFLLSNPSSVMLQEMAWVSTQAGIVSATWWSFDIVTVPSRPENYLAQNGTNTLTTLGQAFRDYIAISGSTNGSGASALGNLAGGPKADFADHLLASGHFWIHKNVGNGIPDQNAFETSVSGEGNTFQASGWDVLVADFTGDAMADFADVETASGCFWVHRNLNQSPIAFDSQVWNWGCTRASTADWELLVGDFDGDGLADVAERQLSTGLLWVKRNLGQGGSSDGYSYLNGGISVARTATGSAWRTIVADFTGDGRAEYADLLIPTGSFWIHQSSSSQPLPSGATLVFNSGNKGEGDTLENGIGWRTVIGDFTGDGKADFADLEIASGYFWVHRNLGGSVVQFQGSDWGWGTSRLRVGGFSAASNMEIAL